MNLSIITCTLNRPIEIIELLNNINSIGLTDYEHIIVDGADLENRESQEAISNFILTHSNYPIRYLTSKKGTAIQRNLGIENAIGNYVAFIDDDIRLESTYFSEIFDILNTDTNHKIGAITGYRKSNHFKLDDQQRWRMVKRLGLLKIYTPGKYDSYTGYPINANMQPPFEGIREVDFLTTSNAVWRNELFNKGLRFNLFFEGYGVLEDCHFSMNARINYDYKLLQCGTAFCNELHSPSGRENKRFVGRKYVINYYFVFNYFFKPLGIKRKFRFFRYQLFELMRIFFNVLKGFNKKHTSEFQGRLEGIFYCLTNDFKKITKSYK